MRAIYTGEILRAQPGDHKIVDTHIKSDQEKQWQELLVARNEEADLDSRQLRVNKWVLRCLLAGRNGTTPSTPTRSLDGSQDGLYNKESDEKGISNEDDNEDSTEGGSENSLDGKALDYGDDC
ncbi:hypothetical protein N7522_002751 [Penicillium canescens]|nr:hypothetical protein N7522_002751 [Penicillium canescens]